MSIKANSHSCSHLLLKIHMPGQDYCSGDCVTPSPPPLTIEWLGWLSGGTFERCQIIKTRRLLCKLSISCAKHILFLFVAKVKSEVRQNHHGGNNKKIILRAMHALYVCVPLVSSEKRKRYCVQPRTGWAIFSFVLLCGKGADRGNDGNPLNTPCQWGT